MEDFTKADKEIGNLNRDTITALHIRVDRWGLKLQGDIENALQKQTQGSKEIKNRYS